MVRYMFRVRSDNGPNLKSNLSIPFRDADEHAELVQHFAFHCQADLCYNEHIFVIFPHP